MKWIVVREYGNGKYMNSIYPVEFDYLSKAHDFAEKLNAKEHLTSFSEKWIPFPLYTKELLD